jgi:hypothetical protein
VPFKWAEAPKADPAPQTADAAAKEARDYAAELLTAMGDPTACLRPRSGPNAPAELAIELEAYVVGAGSVSRSYVRSAQLDADETECIRKRLSSLRFRTPVEDAPRAVRATLHLTLKNAAKTGT